MSKDINILKSAEYYINKYDVNTNVIQLLSEFEKIIYLHKEFETYLHQEDVMIRFENRIKQNLLKMNREKRLIEKRKLFIEWYFARVSNKTEAESVIKDLSELTFVGKRMIQKTVQNETTD